MLASPEQGVPDLLHDTRQLREDVRKPAEHDFPHDTSFNLAKPACCCNLLVAVRGTILKASCKICVASARRKLVGLLAISHELAELQPQLAGGLKGHC